MSFFIFTFVNSNGNPLQVGKNPPLTLMKDRIRKLMESKRMTQQQFASYIGTTPATLSGIFNERQKPTLPILESIKMKFPDINTDWLMFGSGKMFLTDASPSPSVNSSSGSSPLTGQPQDQMLDFEMEPSPTPQSSSLGTSYYNGVSNTQPRFTREQIKIIDKPLRKVTEIRVYYDDQTWESFVPSKK